jgi:Xaa-Pro aminopeptidase
VSFDGGCVVDGYHSDFARAAVIGDLPEPSIRLLGAVERSLDAAATAIAPGQPLAQAHSAAREVLAADGLEEALVNPHSIGHSIGLEHWELPGVGPASDVKARPGMVICLEPQIAGAHGDTRWRNGLFMLEDQLVVTAHGSEILTNAIPRALHSKP